MSGAAQRPSATYALGKFAGHPEFLRPDGEPATSFDHWLDGGWQSALARHGAAWSPGFQMGAAYAFLWGAPRSARCAERLCGVVAPSVDSIGRHYPLAVFARIPESAIAHAPHVVPLAFGDFLEDAYAVLADARAQPIAPTELARRLDALTLPSRVDVARAEDEYAQWCRSAPVEQGWTAIFPGPSPLDLAATALDAIAAAAAGVRGRESPESGVTLRLPLGSGGAAAAVLWMDMVRRACRWKATTPTAFWSADDGALLLALGAPPVSVLGELWRIDPRNESVVDVARPRPRADGQPRDDAAPSSVRLRARDLRQQRPGATIADLLEVVGT